MISTFSPYAMILTLIEGIVIYMINQDDKIDMVYLWCDGNDTAFRRRKQQYLATEDSSEKENIEAVVDMRFFDNEELKYSLRSLELYAPWINHVYIVTDRQVPKWLNTDYEKVTVVDHSEIMPQECIPCFNSDVIEYFLPFIPNLSEKFLYGNDDMFFGKKVYPEDFFAGDKPIVRVKEISRKKLLYYHQKEYTYYGTVLNSLEVLEKAYGKRLSYELHHNIDAYRKSLFVSIVEKFKDCLSKCVNNRFRNPEDIQRTLFNLDMVYTGNAELKIVSDPKPWRLRFSFLKKINWESLYCTEISSKQQKRILKYRPKFFCINASSDCTFEEKLKNKQYMESLFPRPSRFEK